MKLEDVLDSGLQMIHGLSKVTGTKMSTALTAIRLVVEALRDGVHGKTSPEIVQADLDSLLKSISDSDAAADKMLAEKFPDLVKVPDLDDGA